MYRSRIAPRPPARIRATSRWQRGSDRSMRRIALLISLVAVLVRRSLASAERLRGQAGLQPPDQAARGRLQVRAPGPPLRSRRLLRAADASWRGSSPRPPAGRWASPANTGGLGNVNQVYVLKSGHQLQPAAHGAAGRRRHLRARLEARDRPDPGPQGRGDARARPAADATSRLATKTFRLNKPDTAPRLEVHLPAAGGSRSAAA